MPKETKKLFIANRKYSEVFDPIIIFAKDIEEATQKANAYFAPIGANILVWAAKTTNTKDVFTT